MEANDLIVGDMSLRNMELGNECICDVGLEDVC